LILKLEHVKLTAIVSLDEAIPRSQHINKDWLTTVLKKKGALVSGGIRNIVVDYSPSTNSQIARIGVEYDGDARGDMPTGLILKTVAADGGFVTNSEINYYSLDYLGLADAPIPKCYAVSVSDSDSYSVLMEDLSSTHEKDTTPTLEYGRAVAKALARLHAFSWGDQQINRLGGSIPDESKLDQYVGHVRQGLDPLLKATGDIPNSWRQTLLDIFEFHPGKMLDRTKDPNGFTIVHGDINPGNILYPIQNRECTRLRLAYSAAGKRTDANIGHKVYFLDRQPFTWSLTTWLGVSDLSYLMVQFWDTDLRRNLEMSVLREYHQQLLANGVAGYDWDQLLADYRLCTAQAVYTVAEWCIKPEGRQQMQWLWRLELERAMHAVFDLACAPRS
jgi:Phosphotransferase enzyme family